MSRAITIEKFSRYIGEQEQLSCDEILAHAKNLMSMHRDGLQYGNYIHWFPMKAYIYIYNFCCNFRCDLLLTKDACE